MQCHDAQSRLKAAIDGQQVIDAELRAHLGGCAECRAYGEDLRLAAALRSLPLPPASEGFAERALNQAWRASQRDHRVAPPTTAWYWSAAAGLLIAVLVALWAPWRGAPATVPMEMQVVSMAPNSVRQVNVRLVSAEELATATITVRLDDNVGLAGYPGKQVLSWQTRIRAGTNQLSLPVQLLGKRNGRISIEIQSGDARREMRLAIQPEGTHPKPSLLI